MNIFKSHFWYSKSQRNGVLLLIILSIVLQCVYFFIDVIPDDIIDIQKTEVVFFEKQIDSLKILEIEKRKPKVYLFNPNYITDYKGYKLGMTIEEIDRLHAFRKQNKFINSVSDFKKVTRVNDSLLKKIAPLFKFPDWVIKKQKKKSVNSFKASNSVVLKKKEISTNDINLAKAVDFATIKGIGETLSKRIIKYRSRLQGFSCSDQLYEVWNIEPALIKELLSVFKIKEKPIIKKVNINTATFKQVLRTPYVDYDLCKKIFDYRDEVAELQSVSELKNIEGFPVNKYERIVLYLEVN